MKSCDSPLCLGGRIAPGYPSLCNDGVTHTLETSIIGPVRVKPKDETTRKVLEDFCGKDVEVTVCGHMRGEGTCSHLEACFVAEAETAAEKLRAL